ncbi:hypothetical protein FHR90_000669 [Endobacter medicaginis]|uniref:Uncharacterized protein n=1 Tax=Endobacter medicaginis TaxID=1181271 RepID=A0A839UW15_9PROT|nr:hypothetical protein [Endobacter medicaginis]MBB3172855.1 hypothetical protein [Endobacter medicaginis]MCX5474782.1 hypothetical protein [Endobacter medicaginis]NVN29247.1 hypothetical protein [Endobacter medicaginis]
MVDRVSASSPANVAVDLLRPWPIGSKQTVLVCALVVSARSLAAPPTSAPATRIPTDLRPSTDESLTVIGHRPLVLAPLPGSTDLAPPSSGFAPGNRLGPFTITGGPTHSMTSDGVSAGLAIPIRPVKGLEFGVTLGANRDAGAGASSTAGARAVAGFKLRF